MVDQHPEITGKTIVLIGDFNPAIFYPVWFANEGLIRKKEAEKAEIHVVHPDVCSFTLEWLNFYVSRTQLSLETMQEQYEEVLRDLTLSTFKILRYTPIIKMGINTQSHWRINTTEKWHEIGHKLAPKNMWNKLFKNPGLRKLTIQESPREDGLKGHIQVNVEPSTHINPGLFFSINDHFEIADETTKSGSDEIMDILDKSWNDSCKKAKKINKTIIGEFK